MPLVRNYSRYNAQTLLFKDIQEFLDSRLQEGIQVVPFGQSTLELLVENRQSTTTLVLFHAAIDPRKTTLPVFIGQQLTSEIDANLIFISEPALDLGAPIGWFTGTTDCNLQNELVPVIAHIQDSLKTAQHLIFYGSSAGGFASLFYSYHFPGSLCIAANPQTDIAKYHSKHIKIFNNRVWGTEDINKVPAQTEICSLYSSGFPNYVAYLQNSDDGLHVQHHCLPWARATKQFTERRKFLVGDWGVGHAPPDFFLLQGILHYAISLDGDWQKFLSEESFKNVPDLSV